MEVRKQKAYVSEYEPHFSSNILKSQYLAAREELGLVMYFWYNFMALFCPGLCRSDLFLFGVDIRTAIKKL